MSSNAVGIGILGFGGFAMFAAQHLAVTMEQADEIVALARDTRRLLVTNLMQRYNPLFSQIKALVDSKLLGDVVESAGRVLRPGSG
jgi:predicted dehydrogenase